jgi:hypothetical protein
VGPLNEAIGFILRRRALREGLGVIQIPPLDLVPVALGKIEGEPLIPVELCCAPEDATALGQFSFSEQARWAAGQPDPLIQLGRHKFDVAFPDARYTAGSFEMEIRPPYRVVQVPVGQATP